MVEKNKQFRFPDDDGRRQRAWITDGEERGRDACLRVARVLSARPWIEKVMETARNGDDDRHGIDINILVDEQIMTILGMWERGQLIPVQVKSSEHEQRKFAYDHRKVIFNVKKRSHLFVLNGQDALDLITADLAGQMIVLAHLSGRAGERAFLSYLEAEMRDPEIAKRYWENRELLLDTKWYGELIWEAEQVR